MIEYLNFKKSYMVVNSAWLLVLSPTLLYPEGNFNETNIDIA
jgi:hypothetical protein